MRSFELFEEHWYDPFLTEVSNVVTSIKVNPDLNEDDTFEDIFKAWDSFISRVRHAKSKSWSETVQYLNARRIINTWEEYVQEVLALAPPFAIIITASQVRRAQRLRLEAGQQQSSNGLHVRIRNITGQVRDKVILMINRRGIVLQLKRFGQYRISAKQLNLSTPLMEKAMKLNIFVIDSKFGTSKCATGVMVISCRWMLIIQHSI